ncbi:MAG: sterol desaturase family protein [Chitinophagaceae bacterium]|nr:MAG: sterol desaturase family protein [Chitinophagaceae bacterium]
MDSSDQPGQVQILTWSTKYASTLIHHIFDTIGVPVLVVIFVLLYVSESRFELRKRVGNKWKRTMINSIVSIPAFTLLRFLFLPVMVWIASTNLEYKFGLNYLYTLPAFTESCIAFLMLDYGNYIWHFLNHKLGFLWRFHLVHHTDPDLDITTAFRFHFGELIGSVISRGAVVLLTGSTPELVLIYEIIFEAATQFHHSNWKLPLKLEKILNLVIVTPRMHGIHHSIIRQQTDSNYSVVFSFWDRIHKTACLNVDQNLVVTGVPAYSDQSELTIGYLLKLPFKKIRPWNMPGVNGRAKDQTGRNSADTDE